MKFTARIVCLSATLLLLSGCATVKELFPRTSCLSMVSFMSPSRDPAEIELTENSGTGRPLVFSIVPREGSCQKIAQLRVFTDKKYFWIAGPVVKYDIYEPPCISTLQYGTAPERMENYTGPENLPPGDDYTLEFTILTATSSGTKKMLLTKNFEVR